MKVQGRIKTVVSDWRDISSHYILSQLEDGKQVLSGFQRNVITDLTATVAITKDDDLVRCITPNEQEDFLLLNKKDRVLRSFMNTAARNSDKMVVTRCRKIKIGERDKPSTDGLDNLQMITANTIHTAVGSKDDKYLLLFSKFDLLKAKIEVYEQTSKEKKAGNSHKIKEVTMIKDFNIQSMQVIDSDYCYSLSNESSKQGRPGFYI